MEAFVTGPQAKKNLTLAGRIAVGKHLLKVACSNYPNPKEVLDAASLRVVDLWQNRSPNHLLKAFAKVAGEVESEVEGLAEWPAAR